jgi:hypothetical protein
MLTKKTPDTIKATLTVKAMGVDTSLILTYHNHSPDAFDAFVKNPESVKAPDNVDPQDTRLLWAHMNAGVVLFIVKSFDDGTDEAFPLTREGLVELERTWPETLPGIIAGYHKARAASVEKN